MEKINSKIKISNNSSFVRLISAILAFRIIGRSTFDPTSILAPTLRGIFDKLESEKNFITEFIHYPINVLRYSEKIIGIKLFVK